MIGRGDRIGQHVLFDYAAASNKRVAADAAELVDRAQPADVGVILDRDVASKGDAVGENRIVANDDVVRHVYIGHEQIAVADRGKQAATFRAAMNSNEFAD